MGWWNKTKTVKSGPQIAGWKPIILYPADTRYTFQDRVTWTWPSAVTQLGTRVTSFWAGNQLPSASIVIPGVNQPLWMHPRVLDNVRGGMLSRGDNLYTMGSKDSYNLRNAASTAWNRGGNA